MKNNKENVICDTNIWFDIACGNIKPETISNIELIGTAINIVEIASTPKLYKDFELVIKTIKALEKHYSLIFRANPIEHIISIFNKSFVPNDEHSIRLLDDFEEFEQYYASNNLSDDDISLLKNEICKSFERYDYITEIINNTLSERKAIDKNNNSKEDCELKSNKNSCKSFFIYIITEYYKKEYNGVLEIDINDPNWEQLDFFITAWDDFFKHLEIIYGSKFRRNDWNDLLNLVYVQPGYKYWTNENKRWAKLLRENGRLKSYIYK